MFVVVHCVYVSELVKYFLFIAQVQTIVYGELSSDVARRGEVMSCAVNKYCRFVLVLYQFWLRGEACIRDVEFWMFV